MLGIPDFLGGKSGRRTRALWEAVSCRKQRVVDGAARRPEHPVSVVRHSLPDPAIPA